MSILEKPENEIVQPVKHPSRWRIFFAAEFNPLLASLRSGWFWGSLGVALLLFCLVYQLPFSKRVDIDFPRDRPYLINYYAVERYQDFVYRWTQPDSSIVLPGVGQVPRLKVSLEVAPRPPEYPQPEITLRVNNTLLGNFTPEQGQPPKVFTLEANIPDRNLFDGNASTLNVWMNMPGFLAKGDRRPFGVVVSGISLEAGGLFSTGRPVIPAWPEVAMLLAALAVVFVLARRSGWRGRSAAIGVLFFAVLLAIGLALDRPTVGLSAPLILQSVLIGYPLAVAGIWFTGWWLRRLNLAWTLQHAGWLVAIFAFAFIFRLVGLNNPSLQTLDHGFRVNEVLVIEQNPGTIFEHYYNLTTYQPVGGQSGRAVEAGQWGLAVSIPYTPFFYLLDLPLAWLTPNRASLLYWTNVYGAWFDVSAVFFLYIIARQTLGRFGHRSGLAAAVLYGFFPLSFLMVSDGGYNSMVAHWLTLAYIMLLTSWFVNRATAHPPTENAKAQKPLRGWRANTLGGFVLTMVFLSHSATMVLVAFMLAVLIGLLFWWPGKQWRGFCAPLGLQLISALGVSFALYYGFYVFNLLTQTLPTLLSEVGAGKKVGEAALSPTVRGFWPSLWAHFHFFPFAITLLVVGGLTVLYLSKSWPSRRAALEKDVSPPAVMLYLSWLVTFVLFSLIGERINLLQKHMLFAIPLLALGCGLALALLADYFKRPAFEKPGVRLWPQWLIWAAQVATFVFVLYFVIAGSYTWYQRVINYVLPAGTG